VAYLRLAGGLTPGFFPKLFRRVCDLRRAGLLSAGRAPARITAAGINQGPANALVFLAGVFVLALIVNASSHLARPRPGDGRLD